MPYSHPLNYTIRYNTNGLISGLGNYAVGEIFEDGKCLHKAYFQTKEKFSIIYKNAGELIRFLSDLTLDSISSDELDYLMNSDEYDFAASRFLLSDAEFRESVQMGTLIRHISPYNKKEKKDYSDKGILVSGSNVWFYEDNIIFDRFNSKITIEFRLVDERVSKTRTIQLQPCFYKCFLFAVKFNILLGIYKNKEYGRLSYGKFCADNGHINPFISYYDKEFLKKLGYIRLIYS